MHHSLLLRRTSTEHDHVAAKALVRLHSDPVAYNASAMKQLPLPNGGQPVHCPKLLQCRTEASPWLAQQLATPRKMEYLVPGTPHAVVPLSAQPDLSSDTLIMSRSIKIGLLQCRVCLDAVLHTV